jgi:hypothetical protein
MRRWKINGLWKWVLLKAWKIRMCQISKWIAHLICCGDRFESLEVVVLLSVTL